MNRTDLPPEAELLLLIIAAAGGEMSEPAAKREFRRVTDLPMGEFIEWKMEAERRANAHARRAFFGEDLH
jgi:hypothetical protein